MLLLKGVRMQEVKGRQGGLGRVLYRDHMGCYQIHCMRREGERYVHMH